MDPGDRHIAETIDRLRADLAASQREVERLRKLVDRGCEIMEVDLRASCPTGREGADTVDTGGYEPQSEMLRYLAEIGRVEIVSEQGRRVIARWKP